MASIVLTDLFLHDSSVNADYVRLPRRDPQFAVDPQSQVWLGAAGNVRAISRVGRLDTWQLTSRVPDGQVGWLDDHAGKVVLYRDPRGRRRWVLIANLSTADLHRGYCDVTLSLSVVTFDEAVDAV